MREAMREAMREDAAGDMRGRRSAGTPRDPGARDVARRRLASRHLLVLATLLVLVVAISSLPHADAPTVLVASVGALSTATPKSSPTPTRTPTHTPTRTPTKTPTPTASVSGGSAGTLSLLSPANAQGPVGANLTFSGASWYAQQSGRQVRLSASATSCSASGTTSLGQAQIDSDGSFTATVVWPTSLAAPGSAYALCATLDGTDYATAPQSYRLRSAQAPALALSLPTVGVGQATQIGGANFVGATSVQVTLTTTQGPRTLATVAPDPKDGSFTLTYIPTAQDLGAASLSAASAPDGSAPPVLQASAQLQIVAAPPTTTLSQATPNAESAPATTQASSPSTSLADMVLLVVASFLFVLLLIGAVAWIFLVPQRARRVRPGFRRFGRGRAGRGAWGQSPTGAGDSFVPLYPPDDFSAQSGGDLTPYPPDAPTVGPARGWSAPPQVGVSSRATPRTPGPFSGADAARTARVRRDTWAAPQTASRRDTPPGSTGDALSSLESAPASETRADATDHGGSAR